jgi:hypothetical protein
MRAVSGRVVPLFWNGDHDLFGRLFGIGRADDNLLCDLDLVNVRQLQLDSYFC